MLDAPAARVVSLVVFGLALPFFNLRRTPLRLVGGLAVTGIALALAGIRPGVEGAAVLAVGLAAALTLVVHEEPDERVGSAALGGVVLFSALTVAAQGIDLIWRFEQTLAAGYSSLAGLLTGTPARFGATAAGVELLLLGACFLVATLLTSHMRRRRALLAVGLLLLVPLLVVATGAWWHARASVQLRSPEAARVFAQQLLFLPVVALALWFCLVRSTEGSEPAPARTGHAGHGSFAALPVFVGALGLGSLAAPAWLPTKGVDRAPGKVLIHSPTPGLSDFRSPTWEQFGFGTAGIYGELVRWLEATGRDVQVAEGALGATDLDGVSTLVLLLPTGVITSEQRERIHAFVQGGGALLLLSDHTDLFGTAVTGNEILAPYGIEVRFDTAMETARAFTGNLEIRRSGVIAGPVDPKQVQILHGASLRLSGSARPLIVGRTMFGDFGDRHNRGGGAYLGDYRLQPAQEQLGDLVLAATAESGAGRVAVFGDTSSFQNVAFARSANFVLNLFEWLETSRRGGEVWLSRLALLLAMLLMAGWLAGRHAPALDLGAAVALGVLVLFLGPGPLAADNARAAARLPGERAAFLVHSQGLERWDTDHFEDRSIEGLVTCAARDGLFPLVGDAAAVDDLSRFATIVVPAAAGVDATTIERLQAFAEEGGTLVVASGYEERHGVEPLLSGFGLRLLNMPLSSAPVLHFDEQVRYKGPQFAEAWPVAAARGDLRDDEVRFSADGFAIVVERQIGEGRLIVIGDSWFLCDKYLEGEQAYHAGNLAFLRDLLFAPPDTKTERDS